MTNLFKPSVNAENFSLMFDETVRLRDFISFADDDAGAQFYHVRIRDISSGGSSLRLGFSQLDAGDWHSVTYNQFVNNLYMVGASSSSSNNFQIQVFDGANWSDISTFSVNTIATNPNKSVITNIQAVDSPIIEWVDIKDHFDVTDVDGSTPRKFRFRDSKVGGGYFVLDGIAQSENSQFEVTVAELGNLKYFTGHQVTSESIYVSVYDGSQWSNQATIAANIAPNLAAPVISGNQALVRIENRVALRDMMNFADADGNTVKRIRALDLSAASASGTLMQDDTELAAGVWHEFDTNQLSRFTFRGASSPWYDVLRFQAYDGKFWSNVATHRQLTVNNRYAPELEVQSYSVNEKVFRNLSTMFTFTDLDGDALSQLRVRSFGTKNFHGHLYRNGIKMDGNVWYTINANELSQWQYQAGWVGTTTQVGMQASDGYSFTDTMVLDFRSVSSTPVLTSFNKTLVPDTGIATLASMFSYKDAENDPMQMLRVRDKNTFGGSGSLYRVNTKMDAGVWHTFAANELEGWTFRALENKRVDTVEIQAYDGYAWSNIVESIVTAYSNPPEVSTAGSVVVDPSTVFKLSDMFSYYDADGHPMERIRVIEGNTNALSGYLAKNGVKQDTLVWHEILISELSQWTYVSAGYIGGDRVRFRAYDGYVWSTAASLDVNSTSTPPTVDGLNRTVLPVTALSLASLFVYDDLDGDPMVRFKVTDLNTDFESGYLTQGGVKVAAGVEYTIEAANLGDWGFVSGDFIGSDNLQFQVYDGYSWSSIDIGNVASDTGNPSVIALDYTRLPFTSLALVNMFQYSDGDNLPIQWVEVRDMNAASDSGYFDVNGEKKAALVWHQVAAADFADWFFVSGAHLVFDDVEIRASNGYKWSNVDTSTIDSYSNTPTVQALTKAIDHMDSVDLKYLFQFMDVDGDSLAKLRIIDRNDNNNSGYLSRNGAVMPAKVWHEILASDLENWEFVGGNYLIEDAYSIQVSDGHTWSTISNARLVWRNLYDPLLSDVSKPARQQSGTSVDSGLGYLFKFPGNVQGDNFQVLGGNLYNAANQTFLDPEIVYTFTRTQFQNDIRVVSSSPDNSHAILNMEQLLVRVEIDGIWSQWSNINLLDAPNINDAMDQADPLDSFWSINEGDDPEFPATTLYYYWLDAPAFYYNNSDLEVQHGHDFAEPNAKTKGVIRDILDMYEAISPFNFIEWNPLVHPLIPVEYDLTFGWVDMTDYPFPVDAYTKGVPEGGADEIYTRGGDMWFNTFYNSGDHDITDPDPGEYGYTVYIREIARALGLEYTTTGPVQLGEAGFDSPDYVGVSHTYNSTLAREIDYHVNPSTPMLYEILEIQSRYGVNNNYQTGNNLYDFDETLPEVITIWDAGGTDTISFENVNITSGDGYSAMIDLRDGASSYLYDPNFPDTDNINFFHFGRITIAFNAVIENAIGSDGDDYLIGNNFDNDMMGGLGNDVMIGGAGDDFMNGGLGDDRYLLTFGHQAAVAFGHDSATIFEDNAGGQDRVEVYDYDEFLAIMDRDVIFEKDFAFHRNDEDLFIELTMDNNAAEASIAIQRQDLVNSQVETLRFFGGIDVDLVYLFDQMTTQDRWTRFELTESSTANGLLVSQV